MGFPSGDIAKLLAFFIHFYFAKFLLSVNVGERICSLPVLDKAENLFLQVLSYLENIERFPLDLP